MSKKVKEIISYFENLYQNNAVYLWGANGEIITKELCDRLFRSYGSSSYNRTYYEASIKKGPAELARIVREPCAPYPDSIRPPRAIIINV